MQGSGPAQGPSIQWRRFTFCGLLFLLFPATVTYAQDVAEAARQEQARKATQQKPPRYVYTDEDLQQNKILTPEDQAKVEARKKQQDAAPAQQNAERVPSDVKSPTESLGEVARRYRQEKARAAEAVEKKKFAPFPYKVPEESLAVAKPGVAPGIEIAPRLNRNEHLAPTPLSGSHSASSGTGSGARVSPFQPRRSLAPAPMLHEAPAGPLVAVPVEHPKAPVVEPGTVVPSTPPRTPTVVHPSFAVPAARAVAPLVVPSTPSRTPAAKPSAASNPLPSLESLPLQHVQVQRGQSWWKLAERYLGSGARWSELRRLNAEASGSRDLLKRGAMVLVPERVQTRESPLQRSVTVKKGNSLWMLARQHLGRGSEWMCLAEVNPQLSNYTHLTIGTSLQLPSREALESCRIGRPDKLQN
jgi:nucleoid-associated protein YgaU